MQKNNPTLPKASTTMNTFKLEEFRETHIPSEIEIISHWKCNTPTPVVSFICLTFNQEEYIEDAIRGFLIQKTSFPFEIIIHDDASTDSTARKIIQYTKQYPRIIKSITQKENQYSKSPNSVIKIAASLAQGEYIAFCEGDDFWIHPEKIETQIQALKKSPKIDIAFHAALIRDEKEKCQKISAAFDELSTIDLDTAISSGASLMPTASIVVKKSVIDNLPHWFEKAPVGDYFIQILGSINGAIYLPKIMSVYRMHAKNSWTSRTMSNSAKYISNTKRMLSSIDSLENHLAELKIPTKKINTMRARMILQLMATSKKEKSFPGLISALKLIKPSFAVQLSIITLEKTIEKLLHKSPPHHP